MNGKEISLYIQMPQECLRRTTKQNSVWHAAWPYKTVKLLPQACSSGFIFSATRPPGHGLWLVCHRPHTTAGSCQTQAAIKNLVMGLFNSLVIIMKKVICNESLHSGFTKISRALSLALSLSSPLSVCVCVCIHVM